MDTLSAFANRLAAEGNPLRVFDWDKAALLIKSQNPNHVEAGLSGDWEWTGGVIYNNGQPVLDSYTYLASIWAIPEIEMDGENQDCWKYASETDGWDCGTKWPQSSLDILKND